MPHTNTKTARRRLVSYASLADLSKDLDKVEAAHRAGTLKPLGNHQPGPVLGHIAIAIRGSFDSLAALNRAAPLWLRVIGPLVKSRVLSSPLRPGVRMSPAAEAALWDHTLTFERALDLLRTQVSRLGAPGASPSATHPIFGNLTPAEWQTFHLRHAELHMSFLQP